MTNNNNNNGCSFQRSRRRGKDIIVDNFCCCPSEDDNGNGNGGAQCTECVCDAAGSIPIAIGDLGTICDGCGCSRVTITGITGANVEDLSMLQTKFTPNMTDLTLLCDEVITDFGGFQIPTEIVELKLTGTNPITVNLDSGVDNFGVVASLIPNGTQLKTLDLSYNPIASTAIGYDISGLAGLGITTLKLNGIAPRDESALPEIYDETNGVFFSQATIDSSFFTYFNDASTKAIVISADAANFNTSSMIERIETFRPVYDSVLRLYDSSDSVKLFPLLENLEMKGNNIIFTGALTFGAEVDEGFFPFIYLSELNFDGCCIHSDNNEFEAYNSYNDITEVTTNLRFIGSIINSTNRNFLTKLYNNATGDNNLDLSDTTINSTNFSYLNNCFKDNGEGNLNLSNSIINSTSSSFLAGCYSKGGEGKLDLSSSKINSKASSFASGVFFDGSSGELDLSNSKIWSIGSFFLSSAFRSSNGNLDLSDAEINFGTSGTPATNFMKNAWNDKTAGTNELNVCRLSVPVPNLIAIDLSTITPATIKYDATNGTNPYTNGGNSVLLLPFAPDTDCS